MRRRRRQASGPVRGNRLGKLKAAFRYDLERRGHHEWLADLNREYPDEVPTESLPTRPDEARYETWHDFYRRAWQTLRYDRQYTEGGGETPISFLAFDAYARRYCIEGEAFDRFVAFVSAIDDEWLIHLAEKRKEAAT
ncbi:hypothetical protein C8D77_101200 [Mesorhizobium loti]|uniref:Uncharacterized protein n=1 Tax=Rhizobium loti TaxID=381 RepID=A0A8E2WIB1_RHILI|nr:hypothetical protein [Mesorhizobium loti]PWJ93521.1 hypothetical protein C8D77_101200 [Mesorhizobium loti]